MKLYWIKAQAPRRVLALIKHLKLSVETIEVDAKSGGLKTDEYAKLNPNKRAPTLVDGERVLWESSAIMAHLCVRAASDMWPAKNPAEQVEVLRWLSWNDCHWAPAVGPFYFEYIVRKTYDLGPPIEESLTSKVPDVLRHADVLDGHLSETRFAACDRLTIADFQLASMASDWKAARMPLESFPNVVQWLNRLDAIPAWADPWPVRQPPGHTGATNAS
jgi:glutathione S-transferase